MFVQSFAPTATTHFQIFAYSLICKFLKVVWLQPMLAACVLVSGEAYQHNHDGLKQGAARVRVCERQQRRRRVGPHPRAACTITQYQRHREQQQQRRAPAALMLRLFFCPISINNNENNNNTAIDDSAEEIERREKARCQHFVVLVKDDHEESQSHNNVAAKCGELSALLLLVVPSVNNQKNEPARRHPFAHRQEQARAGPVHAAAASQVSLARRAQQHRLLTLQQTAVFACYFWRTATTTITSHAG